MYDKFSLENFKKWMSEQKTEQKLEKPNKTSKLIGLQVESKINCKRIPNHILSHDGNLEEIMEEFKDGGKIMGVDGVNFLIETDSGDFTIHRCYIKKKSIENI